jgi:hypothetical protein
MHLKQCCQEVEISAAELIRGPTKMFAARKLAVEFSSDLPKSGRTFWIHINWLRFLQEICFSSPDICDILFPLVREKVCEKQ